MNWTVLATSVVLALASFSYTCNEASASIITQVPHDNTPLARSPQIATTYIEVMYDVPLIPQQTGMSCWAAGAAMLVSWRDRISIDPSEIAAARGYWAQYQQGLDPEDTGIFPVWGMVAEPAQTYTVEGFKQLLETYGPLWVASATPSAHIRVVTGLRGDGTPEGTFVYINDPWERGMKSFRSSNRGSRYQETYAEFVQKQAELARRESSRSGAIYVAHLN